MKKEKLKEVLKPLVKECIKEVILEEGILSGIVSEVAQGLSNTQVINSKPATQSKQTSQSFQNEALVEARKSLEDTKKSLQEVKWIDRRIKRRTTTAPKRRDT